MMEDCLVVILKDEKKKLRYQIFLLIEKSKLKRE